MKKDLRWALIKPAKIAGQRTRPCHDVLRPQAGRLSLSEDAQYMRYDRTFADTITACPAVSTDAPLSSSPPPPPPSSGHPPPNSAVTVAPALPGLIGGGGVVISPSSAAMPKPVSQSQHSLCRVPRPRSSAAAIKSFSAPPLEAASYSSNRLCRLFSLGGARLCQPADTFTAHLLKHYLC